MFPGTSPLYADRWDSHTSHINNLYRIAYAASVEELNRCWGKSAKISCGVKYCGCESRGS